MTEAEIKKIEHGAGVRITHKLKRIVRQGFRNHYVEWHKVWIPEPLEKPGLFLGWRQLANGRREYLGYEEGIAFEPLELFVAALVSTGARVNPVYVLPEHVEVIS